ncbi:MAG: S8 family peptidase [Mobilitalea sp.]
MPFHKKNLILKDTYEVNIYTSDSARGSNKFKPRDKNVHGNHLLSQLNYVWSADEQHKAMFATLKQQEGIYIEFKGAENCDLITKSLENASQGIKLLNLRDIENENGITQSATVYIPKDKKDYFNKKVQEYLEKYTNSGKPKNKDLVESIETIQLAVISSFWIGDINDMPNETEVRCEFWLWSELECERQTAKEFYHVCQELQIQHDKKMITFPEKVVVMVNVNKVKLQLLINTSDRISEIRRAPETNEFYLDLNGGEAAEWIADLNDRIEYKKASAYICILDTGINKGHPLLQKIISDDMIQSSDDTWKSNDHEGHGTRMAGICEYFDLEQILTDNAIIELSHRLESVKILPDDGSGNEPRLYGAIIEDATSKAEIVNPNVKRVFCMAVTAEKYATKDGSPSSWSAELDKIIYGTEDGIKKLFVVSAGNVSTKELEQVPYKDANINHVVEDPGQSWNALTVGAFTDKIEITDYTFTGWQPIADANELSPFSSTSLMWDSRWPIKPEILLEGGNAITDGSNVDTCDEVSLLTTNWKPVIRPFATLNATSSATAQAANIAARLMVAYPKLWEETIRGLMVHSAKWTDKMKKQFCMEDKKTLGRRELLRICGYGVASFNRAADSMNNSVNMIIQAELQPYCKEGNDYKTKDMHLHKLPWPKNLLRSLENTEVSMKVTLSYYIEPAPDHKGWNNKYRYSSSGLRFEVINKNQSKEDFMKRVNVAARGDNTKDKGDGSSGSDRWFLGKDNRDVGSVHSDTWTSSAIELAESDYIAVYPVIGWWRERHNLGMYDKIIRYALIVTLSTPSENIDFYTPIETIINTEVKVPVEIQI